MSRKNRRAEPTYKEIMAFERMVAKAAGLHAMTWCVKIEWPRWTLSLRARECLRCEHFICNGGVCDPL